MATAGTGGPVLNYVKPQATQESSNRIPDTLPRPGLLLHNHPFDATIPLIGGLPRALLSFAIGTLCFSPYVTSRGRRRRMKRARVWIGIAISLICLALALRGIDLEGLALALRSVRWTYLLLAFGFMYGAGWLRALRWRALFYPETELSLSTLFSIINIGYLFINVLPVRAGEVIRAFLAGELLGTGAPRAFSTVILEKVLDVLTMALLLLGLAPFVPLPQWAMRAGLLAGAGAAVLTVVMVVVALNRERGVRLGEWLGRWLPERFRGKFVAAWASLIDGFTVLKTPGQLARVILLSVVVWAVSAMVGYSVLVGFALPAPPVAALLVLCTTALGMVIPSSPGYIGVYEYIVVLALSLFGVDREVALSYALVLHGLIYVGQSLLGVLGLWKESLSYSDIRGRAAEAAGGEERSPTG
jgi:uncharacterized protein (TIRG00374 family)